MNQKALAVISFGTTYTLAQDAIMQIESALSCHAKEYDCFRAFTSRMVIAKLKREQGQYVLTPEELMEQLYQKGYNLFATGGTHQFLTDNGIPAVKVYWPSESDHEPQALEMLHNKQIDLVVNIPKNLTQKELDNGYKIRRAAIDFNIPLITNARLASAFIQAFCSLSIDDIQIKSWDEYK